jgi:hypothetical protein
VEAYFLSNKNPCKDPSAARSWCLLPALQTEGVCGG